MSNLDSQIDSACAILRDAEKRVNQWRASTSAFKITEPIRRSWEARLGLYARLEVTKKLLPVRMQAMNELLALKKACDGAVGADLNAAVPFNGRSLPIFHGRLLGVQSYLATTWSIYDRLTCAIGRLIGTKTVVSNTAPHLQAKLVEDILGTKGKTSYDVCALHQILDEVYSWDIHCGYLVRNAFMHDGGLLDERPLLDDTNASTAFVLSVAGQDALEKAIKNRMKWTDDNGQAVQHPAIRPIKPGDAFLDLLAMWNGNIDEALGALLVWSVTSFVSQIVEFAAVDGFAL